MIPNHPRFIEALHGKKKVRVRFYSTPDCVVMNRVFAPLDHGPGTENPEGVDRYWLWDYEAGAWTQILGLAPQQMLEMQVLDDGFDPVRMHPLVPPLWSVPRAWDLGSTLVDRPLDTLTPLTA